MMIIIRPIAKKDQNLFSQISRELLLGMTNLPKNREELLEKIHLSEESFKKNNFNYNGEEYYFVLEDTMTNEIGGTCGILAKSTQSFHHCFRIQTLKKKSALPSIQNEIKVLKVVKNLTKSSEVCSLYLQPSFRHSGLGRLLSLSRFLFIAAFPERFKKKIGAELRGYIDSKQNSPFWDSIGRHFCDLSFTELMARLDQLLPHISEILPKYPIYISLLPKEAQESIGKTHENTRAAYEMLIGENFYFHHLIDLFEGGPILSAETKKIRSIKNSKVITVDLTSDRLENEKEFIIGNEKLDFRACYAKIQLISKNRGIINEKVAEQLLIKQGDKIRYVTSH